MPSIKSSKTHFGWTLGLGAEYAFTQNWIGRAEVRYTDFGSETHSTAYSPIEVKWNQVSTTLGLSYKF